jgi:hypothetical protein
MMYYKTVNTYSKRLFLSTALFLAMLKAPPTLFAATHCQPLGDIDCSGSVNSLDLGTLLSRFGSTDPDANLDDQGTVNSLDLGTLLSNMGKTAPTPKPTGSSTAKPSITATPKPSPTSATRPPTAPNGYYTKGNTIYTVNDTPIIFKGVAKPSMSWWYEMGDFTTADFQKIKAWNANLLRLPMNQSFWLENKGDYQGNIKKIVDMAKANGLDVMLDLHTVIEKRNLPNTDSIKFWQQVAAAYKGDGRVFFELYNEPHDISADVWKNGDPSKDYIGMQKLYDAVRQTGANNLVVIGGTAWAYDLKYVHTHPIQGYNIVYSTHPYNGGDRSASVQETDYGFIVTQNIAPVMLTEFGNTQNDCDAKILPVTLDYATSKKMSWTGWAWFVPSPQDVCSFPAMFKDDNYTTTPEGDVFKRYMLQK